MDACSTGLVDPTTGVHRDCTDKRHLDSPQLSPDIYNGRYNVSNTVVPLNVSALDTEQVSAEQVSLQDESLVQTPSHRNKYSSHYDTQYRDDMQRNLYRHHQSLNEENSERQTGQCTFLSDPMKITILHQHVEEMLKRAVVVLDTHQGKIQHTEDILSKLGKQASHVPPVEDFHAIDQQRQALQNKLDELLLQKREFQNFLASAHEKCVEIRDSEEIGKSSHWLMKAFDLECSRLDKALPIYARRSDILQTVVNNQVSVIIGDTGSGKSTQMTQYLYQSAFAKSGTIVCTQPRKVAAISVATHVAEEMKTSVGQVIGYKVGMQEKMSTQTKVLYMTDHILLKECLKDRNLSSFTCIIIDEAHERSIYTDLLLGMIKSCLKNRPDLRVVITSATIDPEVFVRYFESSPVLYVSGRMFPVEIEWKNWDSTQESFSNHVDESVRKAIDVHNQKPPGGDILVFLTSPQETEKCCEKFVAYTGNSVPAFVCMQLHGKLQTDDQRKVFAPLPSGVRKIVFATNSAETSVTIPGIRYVIDPGLVKEMNYDAKRNINALSITTVSKSSADQRKGRAGRTAPGVCYRLYTEDEYNAMTTNKIPDILRVNLGHAILKLTELDIDPLEFDFVMSPSSESMQRAFEELEDIGAISQRKITDLGKWISKLPLDPKFGVFVHDTLTIGTGIEGIVIAAACGENSMFYRAGSIDDKEQADRNKIPFCHASGDLLTMLNVFREWNLQPEKAKGKWCMQHSVNGKTMKGLRDTANEILTTLKRDLGTTLQFRFDDPEEKDHLLLKPILKTFRGNICHCLGHPKAGYNLVAGGQRVEVHPSSTLKSLASQPEWFVFDQVMRTSKDFAMNITPISEDMVRQGITEGLINADIDEATRKQVLLVHRMFVGAQLMREFVGPRYTSLRSVELELVKKCNGSLVVVEADRENGEIAVFSILSNKQLLVDSFEEVLNHLKAQLQAEETEEQLGVKSSDGSVRAIIGEGGCTKTILMPDEFRIVMVQPIATNKSGIAPTEILAHFSKFGKVQDVKKFQTTNNKSGSWGQVTYGNKEDAVKAVAETKGHPSFSVRPYTGVHMGNKISYTKTEKLEKFKVKIQWCRRPSKGFGFVTFANSTHAENAIRHSSMVVGGASAKVRPSKSDAQHANQNDRVHVVGLGPSVSEDVLRQSVASCLGVGGDVITKVVVIREKVALADDTTLYLLKDRIQSYALEGTFTLELRPLVRDTETTFTAFAAFESHECGQRICAEIDQIFQINGLPVTAKPVLHCSVFIPKEIHMKNSDLLRECTTALEAKGLKVKKKQLRNEAVVVDITTDSAESLVGARKAFQDIIMGEVLDDEHSPLLKTLLTREGRAKMQEIMDETDTLIAIDNRVKSVSIHGSQPNKEKAKHKLNVFMQELSSCNSAVVDLKRGGKPPGILKALIVKYDINLTGLCQDTGLVAVKLDHRKHKITLIGSDEAIEKAQVVVQAIVATGAHGKTDEEHECVTCFCPVEQEDRYRVECCGHMYCKECLQIQLQSNDFPVMCEHSDCRTSFTWTDVRNMSKFGLIKMPDLINSSVSNFVQQNKEFRYCITPDCPIVYRIAENGEIFVCPECDVNICSSCHSQSHYGVSCMFKNAENDVLMEQWFAERQDIRKRCPNCTIPIEKNGGCNRVGCQSCKKHICWVCMEYFDDCGPCYSHLSAAHGSFF